MNSSRPLGFAIVGTGSIARLHAVALREVEGAALRAVYNRSPGKARAFAADHGADAVDELPALLAREDVDVVCITTPTGAHGDPAIAAFAAGKHVLCEKPLETTLERVDAMLAAAARHRRILAAVFQSRFGPGARALKQAVDQGRFGRLTLCSAHIRWWRSQQYYDEVNWRGTWRLDGGGALMNQGIHGVDLLQWLVGLPAEVSAHAATLAHERVEAEDTLVASLRFAHGALGVIECATSAYPGTARRIEISGDRGSAVLEDDRLTRWEFRDPAPGDEEVLRGGAAAASKGGASDPRAITHLGHRLQMEDLVEAIRRNRPPAIPGEDGRRAVQLVRAIYEAAAESRVVRL